MDSQLTYERASLRRHKRGSWYLYIIRTGNVWAPYIGITTNPVRRFREHAEGKGHYYTRKYGVRSMHVLARYSSYHLARLAERKTHVDLGVVDDRTASSR